MIGIFGGRFDPIHRAHLAMAQAAADQMQLKELLWVVSANAVHKSIVASAPHRLAMVQIALDALGDSRMKVDSREIETASRGEDNPSHKTLASLQRERPTEEWLWVLGEDQLQAFTTWQRWEWLAQNMALGVCRRLRSDNSFPISDALLKAGARIHPIEFKPDPVSSSQVRDAIAAGLPISGLVPAGVAEYMASHSLYC